ncbi:MAG: helix-turn-helix transcriptional regulator [Lachnospiraceae bacterium]|nr:helix-turn-helix transcriptional regulator [Lachnospiraceae bacterium]
MERKTIGGFIAALRKANGMTQKELAEKINVSDKTVSRWERDDGAPDLSVIPVIAEIFGVTCDELLRGERKSAAQRTAWFVDRQETGDSQRTESNEVEGISWPASSKAEKQRQRILTVSLSQYKNRSFIAMGLSVVGLIAAMIGNFGFLRAYIGFLVGVIFYLVSVVCQAIFVNGAFLAVSDESLVTIRETGEFKYTVIRMAELSIGLTVVLFGFSLPLVIFAYDTYMGLSAQTWLVQGLGYGLISLLVVGVCCYFLNAHWLRKGIYSLDAKKEERYWSLHKRKIQYAFRLLLVLLATGVFQFLVMTKWSVSELSDSTDFYDYESFVEYMEQDIPYEYHQYIDGMTAVEPVQRSGQGDEITYYDQYGNVISEEDALRAVLMDLDGNTIVTYIKRNQSVVYIDPGRGQDRLPIRTITQDQWHVGLQRYNVIQTAFVILYGLEVVGTILLYLRKRTK